jgi:hypothetical protein
MPRESFIVAVSGQPTKNLGATIINAGNTPAGAAGTNDATNNPAFGTLLGSNTGKGSGAKVVERSAPASSGVGGSTPGVQVASNQLERKIASPTVGSTTAKSLTMTDDRAGKGTIGWKNVFSQHPTKGSPRRSIKHNHEYSHHVWPDENRLADFPYCARGDRSEFGSSVQIARRDGGSTIIAAGAPSGQPGLELQVHSNPFPMDAPGGYVDSWENGVQVLPGQPGELGTLNSQGFAEAEHEKCFFAKSYRGDPIPGGMEVVCPGHLKGFNRTRNRLKYNGHTDTSQITTDAYQPRHTLTASGAGVGQSVAFNTDGSRMAVGMPYAQEEKGEVRVYELCDNPASGHFWFKVGGQISGNQKGDRFGWSVALDGVGNTMFSGAPKGAGGSGYVQLHELSGYGGSASWAQTAAACSSGVAAQDRYGYSVSCNKGGDIYAVGAPGGSGTRGYAQMFGYGAGKWITMRRNKLDTFRQSQQAAADNGKTKVQRIVGEASGERLGWSVDLMYNCELPGSLGAAAAGKYNIRVAVGSPYWSSTVSKYDFSKRNFRERAAGVPIEDGQGSSHPDENGAMYGLMGMTSEGRVTCWGYSGEAMLNTAKYGYAFLEYIQFGKSSSKTVMKGDSAVRELGYSVKLSDEGDFLVAGAPGTNVDKLKYLDCLFKDDASKDKGGEDGDDGDTVSPPFIPGDDCQYGDFPDDPMGHKEDFGPGAGAVRVYRYLWKGSDGEDARKEHYRDVEDYFVQYGPTIRGQTVNNTYRTAWLSNKQLFKNNHRYERPNFQHYGFNKEYARVHHGERFGTSVAIMSQFNPEGELPVPQVVVGAPYAMDEDYHFSRCVFEPCTAEASQSSFYNPSRTGRVDSYLATPTFGRDNVVPMGAGRNKSAGSTAISTRTKPKLNFASDGTPILGSGTAGGRESFFIAPNVSGSGLANDNALKSSRKTFGTGGINFTSSD